jgi:dTDP-4-amino-4,6-dideoxygalactose transaminase
MFVGGEFYTDNFWLRDTPTLSSRNMIFLNGGKACLVVLGDYLIENGISKILLPSYLCPTIVSTLEHCGLFCDYYQINPDFSIDLDDLSKKATNHKAVYFINYFGFFHPLPVRNYLAGLRQKGVVVVEDNAQAGFANQITGNFIFNSIRKLAAYDGGYLITPYDVIPHINKYQSLPNRRLPVIRDYRKRLAAYLFQGTGNHEELVELYERAEAYYESDLVVEGDPQEREQIERLDWMGIQQARRENYTYLLSLISGISELSPVFPALQEDNMPLGLPVYVLGVSRDWLLDELGNTGIGLTVHWNGLLSDPRLSGNPVTVDMASRILTLVIDQRISHKQMDYLAQNIIEWIRLAKNRSSSQKSA